ncbi:unnamed protein product, partial [Darwinula stevensoni]
SIGQSTLSVIAQHPEKFQVFALTAYHQLEKLAQLTQQFRPHVVVLRDHQQIDDFIQYCQSVGRFIPEILTGEEGLISCATDKKVDMVMAAIVGAAGLAPTIAAARAGKKILLANKESLVVAGQYLMDAVKHGGGLLIPVDSEHNAIFQSLPEQTRQYHTDEIDEIILTASGGPFLNTPIEEFAHITPEQACKHPNWSMGRKISVDSATMMNKGLELIEAFWLFACPLDRLKVLIHPQSIIHSMVRYCDGSLLAQLGSADMRIPIAYAMAYPNRIPSGAQALDFTKLSKLTFFEADTKRFPCLALAYQALAAPDHAPTILNAANEVAVATFLDRRIAYHQIAPTIEKALKHFSGYAVTQFQDLLALDDEVRAFTHQMLREVARLLKIGVQRFSIGMGKVIYRHRSTKTGVEWVISLLPLGGYVLFTHDPAVAISDPRNDPTEQLIGDEKSPQNPLKPGEKYFTDAKPWERILVAFAGPFANLVFATILFTGVAWTDGQTIVHNQIAAPAVQSWAAQLGLKANDAIAEGVALVKRAVTLNVDNNVIGGPITIAKESGKAAQYGFAGFVVFLAMLSVSLGFINLLPIPVLDGGQILLNTLEWIRGKPLSTKMTEWITRIGMAMVLMIMTFAIMNDVRMLFEKN